MGRNSTQGSKNLSRHLQRGKSFRLRRLIVGLGDESRVYNVSSSLADKFRERFEAQGYTVRDESPAPPEGV